MIFVHVLGLSYNMLLIYDKRIYMHTPVRLQGWSNSAGQEVMLVISVGRLASGAF